MNSIIFYLNSFITKVTDLILIPFNSLSPVWGLVFISALSGVALIYIYGLVSNQAAIKKVKRKISASILEVILYRHDISLCLKAQGKMLGSAARYFLLAVPPLIILMIPCLFVLSQLNLRYENRALRENESLIVTAKLADPSDLMNTSLESSNGLAVTPALRMSDTNEISWRLDLKEPATQKIIIKAGAGKTAFENPIQTGTYNGPIFANSLASWVWSILYPSAEKIDPARFGFSELSLSSPKGEHSLFSLKLHWVIIFFIVSLVSGLLASRFLKIEI